MDVSEDRDEMNELSIIKQSVQGRVLNEGKWTKKSTKKGAPCTILCAS